MFHRTPSHSTHRTAASTIAHRLVTALALGLAACLFTGSLMAADGTVRLNFGVYSANKPSAMVKTFKPTLKELERRMAMKLGVDVDIRMQIARDYDQGISNLSDGKVDFSQFGPASYVEAKRANDGLRIIAVEKKNNSKVFYGIIAVHADSDIENVSQLAGRSFAFGDEGSTIGRFLSQLYLEKNGIHAGDLSKYEYLGRHDRVGTAVGARDFDAGALNEKTFKKLVEAGEPIRELVRFPNVTKPWIARSGLDDNIYKALRDSLLEIDDMRALAGLKVDGFLAGNDADYEDIRVAIANNSVFFSDTQAVVAPPAQKPMATQPTQLGAAAPVVERMQPSSAVVRQGNQITVNITLPGTIYHNGDSLEGPTHLTVNVLIPEPNASSEAPGQ